MNVVASANNLTESKNVGKIKVKNTKNFQPHLIRLSIQNSCVNLHRENVDCNRSSDESDTNIGA